MRIATLLAAVLLLAGCPYRTQIYRSNADVMRTSGDDVQFGTQMKIDNASAETIDLATLAAGCDSGVIAAVDEIRGFAGFNIFTGSRRSLEVWCGVVGGETAAAMP